MLAFSDFKMQEKVYFKKTEALAEVLILPRVFVREGGIQWVMISRSVVQVNRDSDKFRNTTNWDPE